MRILPLTNALPLSVRKASDGVARLGTNGQRVGVLGEGAVCVKVVPVPIVVRGQRVHVGQIQLPQFAYFIHPVGIPGKFFRAGIFRVYAYCRR